MLCLYVGLLLMLCLYDFIDVMFMLDFILMTLYYVYMLDFILMLCLYVGLYTDAMFICWTLY